MTINNPGIDALIESILPTPGTTITVTPDMITVNPAPVDDLKTYWVNTEETYKINARDEDEARYLLEEYMAGNWQVAVKCKSSDFTIEEDTL